jgi:hypothetical protein
VGPGGTCKAGSSCCLCCPVAVDDFCAAAAAAVVGAKEFVPWAEVAARVPALLQQIQVGSGTATDTGGFWYSYRYRWVLVQLQIQVGSGTATDTGGFWYSLQFSNIWCILPLHYLVPFLHKFDCVNLALGNQAIQGWILHQAVQSYIIATAMLPAGLHCKLPEP